MSSNPVPMEYTDFGGEGRPVLILHGVFGSSRNWTKTAQLLADGGAGHILGVDLRNHGSSPHADTHNIQDLIADLKAFIDELPRRTGTHLKPIIIGHSMGGLTTMGFALQYPDDLFVPIIADIAPRSYESTNSNELKAVQLDLSGFKSRQEIDRAMTEFIEDPTIRQFLQTNIISEEQGYKWRINVDAISKADYGTAFSAGPLAANPPYRSSALFILGEKSGYVRIPEDFSHIHKFFPEAKIETLAAGHWLHFTHAADFSSCIIAFLQKLES